MNKFTIIASNGLRVSVGAGDGSPKMTDGGGGWEVVPRPRRIALTIWRGRNPYKMDVPFMFNGWAQDKSMEADIAKLNQMQMGANLQEPPTVRFDGNPAVPVKGIKWVIENIDWGDVVIWDVGDGKPARQRQDGIIHLLQFVDDTPLKINKVTHKPVIITTKKGQTLRSIAKDRYGDANQWKKIQKANPKIKDPKSIPPGTKLRIP